MADVWLAVSTMLGGGLLGFGAAVESAKYQTRLTKHHSERHAAMALRVDLQRIQTFFDVPTEQLTRATDPHGRIALPTIHRWSEPIISQLAAADPWIVSECMELDALLSVLTKPIEDLRTRIAQVASGRQSVAWANQHDTAQKQHEIQGNFAEVERDHLAAYAAAHELHERTHTRLITIIGRLSVIADRGEPQFLEFPRERDERALRERERLAR